VNGSSPARMLGPCEGNAAGSGKECGEGVAGRGCAAALASYAEQDVPEGEIMRLLHAALLTALGLSSASAATIDDLYAALETSDTRSVTSFVTDYYRDAGISVNPVLEWQFQAFDRIVNWYTQNTQVSMPSTLPQSADEVAAYWDNWSDVLTRKRWAWRSFFNDDAEAAVMAGFNQFLLAAHEFGHALTYRYDPE